MTRRVVLAVLATVVLAASLLLASGRGTVVADTQSQVAGTLFQRIALLGTQNDLSTGQTTQRLSPSLAYNSVDNQYLAVWFDTRNPNNNDVFGQRVLETGVPTGPNFPLIQFAEAQIDPVVAYNSVDNRYLVVWRTQQTGFLNQARGRRVSSTGTHLGPDFFINSAGHEISAVYNPVENEWFVTGRSSGIRARRVKSDGSLAGSEIVVSPAGAIAAPNGEVAYNPHANEYLVTWRNQAVNSLQGQRLSAGGALRGGPITISPIFPGSYRAASVAFDITNHRYLVVFDVAGEDRILGQFVTGSGALLDSNFTIAANEGYSTPHVVYSPDDRAFLLVTRREDDIVGLILSEGGAVIGAPTTIASDTASGQPEVAGNSWAGDFLVVWPDRRNLSVGEEDIFAQVVDILPVPHGDANCDGAADAIDAALVLQFTAGLISMGLCLPAADVNPDGNVNAVDAALILQHVAGLIPSLPP